MGSRSLSGARRADARRGGYRGAQTSANNRQTPPEGRGRGMSAREETEEAKQVAAALADLVDGTAGAALDMVGAIVREAAGREMAAVLHGKPAGLVTADEAAAALTDYAVEGDADLTRRALRAGVRAAVMKL